MSFQVRAGEILALTGLVGSGRTEAVRLLFGADPRDAGKVVLDGKELAVRSPREAIAAGIGLLTEDRKLQGLVLGHSVRDNFALPNLADFPSSALSKKPKSVPSSRSMSLRSRSKSHTKSRRPRTSRVATSKRLCLPSGWREIATS
ncbi:MAG: ATP-binding cassette domain-containing protein [Pirellulales bacterium]